MNHIAQNPNSPYARLVASGEKAMRDWRSYNIKNTALPLQGVLTLKIRQLLQRFPWTFHGLFSGLRRAYKGSRLLRIASILAAVPLLLVLCLMIYVSYNRTNLPDLEAFIRFEPPTMGHIYDANGHVLIELGREHRKITSYQDIPDVLRGAILSAEDENFFSHSGVDFSVFPRLISKMNISALITRAGNSKGENSAKRATVFPQGGSTITQQLVRGYFLQKLTSAKSSNSLQHDGVPAHVLAFVFGVSGANRILLKVEEMRLSLWIEAEMQKRYGSKRRAKEELFARYASFIYLGNGRYGFAAASQYYFGISLEGLTADDADKAALLAGITKSPEEYAPAMGDNRNALHRRNQILTLMVKNHFISAQTAGRCQQTPIRLTTRSSPPIEAPAAVGHVLDELRGFDARSVPEIGINELLEGRIQIHSTIDDRIQRFANLALENGLKLYERRHPKKSGLIQGSVVVLRNSDSAVLAEVGGRTLYKGRNASYSDYNRVTQSARQPGSAMKPIVYLAAFRQGALNLDTPVPDEPISVTTLEDRAPKWISNFDNKFEGVIPARRALAESRNAVAIWIVQQIGIDSVLKTAQDVGIRTSLRRYETTALGASEVTLLELANAYRFMASGIAADPYVIARIERSAGNFIYQSRLPCCAVSQSRSELSMIQEGLRGVVRIPSGTAHALDSNTFPIPVMGKTGTTNSYRDALFVGSTYGPDGITVAVRIGFDDNRSLGEMETGGRTALPIFREVIMNTYRAKLVGRAPSFPVEMEKNIQTYLNNEYSEKEARRTFGSPSIGEAAVDPMRHCRTANSTLSINPRELPLILLSVVYQRRDPCGPVVFTNE
jgi:penicillin-binding protein 1A